MAKKINVYLQYPWKFPDSPYYKYLTQSPPEGISFVNAGGQKGVITNKKKFLFSNKLKRGIRILAKYIAPSLPNAHLTKNVEEIDLIHCAHCLSKNKNKPWVADIEYTGQLWVMGTRLGKKNRDKVREILRRENCKRIITWTKLMRSEFLSEFPEMKNKLEVVYPGVPILAKKKKHKEINLLFVARYFYKKGGLHALEVMDRITKKYENVKAIFVSEVPEEILRKYSSNKKILFTGLIPQKELIKKYYPISDIFIYPGYSDSFGFAIPEVMGVGIPVISVKGSSREELIDEGKTGYVLKTDLSQNQLIEDGEKLEGSEELINEMYKKVVYLIENPLKRKEMSRNCVKEVRQGKFSINKNNKKIRRIYEGAIK